MQIDESKEKLADLKTAGENLSGSVDKIRYMLYGLALDARQAALAQKAINEAVDAVRKWREATQGEMLKVEGPPD